MRKVSGCLVFSGRKILLVRRTNGGWGLPKGGVEEHLTKRGNALKELFEEAGAVAELLPDFTAKYKAIKRGERQHITVYGARLAHLFNEYPEEGKRTRRLFRLDAAKQWLHRSTHELIQKYEKEYL